ncbi:hypothetical protein ACROYT_G008125 [Oculina patagonica]
MKTKNILDFFRPFKGVFKGVQYDSPSPPKKAFPNHPSCRRFEEFISKEIQSRILTGAVKVWGKVGVAEPPWLVLPLTVEPSKPRLCVDARFLNLWMANTPFSLDKLAEVPRFVYWKSFMTKLDDKAGYDHILLTEVSRTYVGFEWKGRIMFLGLLVDSNLQAFLIPDAKKEKFAAVQESLLSRKVSVPVKLLQKMMGKCISFTLAFPGAKFYIREMASAIGSAAWKLDAPFSPSLREELTFWRFLDSWADHIPWRKEEHVALSLSTDASQSRWAAVVHTGSRELAFGDF